MTCKTAIQGVERVVSPGICLGLLLLFGPVCSEGEVRSQDSPKVVRKSESFDKDPGWDSHNNHVKVAKPIQVVQDFGYSKTNHAGGKAAGEIGGRVQRSTTSAFADIFGCSTLPCW